MIKYFFHVQRHDCPDALDEEGGEFESAAAAKHEATACLKEILADQLRFGHTIRGLAIQIVDELGAVLCGITVADALA